MNEEPRVNGPLNLEMIRKLREAVAGEPLRFDMHEWLVLGDAIAPCGTAGCLAGWTYRITHTVDEAAALDDDGISLAGGVRKEGGPIEREAEIALGLDYGESKMLFWPVGWPRAQRIALLSAWGRRNSSDGPRERSIATYRRTAQKLALKVLDRILKTGKIDWGEE